MLTSPAELQAVRDTADLESTLAAVEAELVALGHALTLKDPLATEAAANQLHQALALAMERFGQVARNGGVPPALRRRLARTGGQVAAQRDAVARASTLLDRTLDLLIRPEPSAHPATPPLGGLYGPGSLTRRSSGLAQA